MLRLNPKHRPKRLRDRLLTPIVFLVLGGSISIGTIEELAARKHMEILINQRGSTVLEGITKRIEDRQRTKEIFAQLLAQEQRLDTAVEQENIVSLAQTLVPLKTKLELGFIGVYQQNAQELLHLGEVSDSDDHHTLVVEAALTGITKSTVVVSNNGLTAIAATPIKSSRGIVGALVVGTTLEGADLTSIQEKDTTELALFHRDGSLVSTTASESKVVKLLRRSQATSSNLAQLNQKLAALDVYASAKFLANGDLLVALISTEDLLLASRQRELFIVISTIGLVGAILFVGLLLVQNIAQPLEQMVDTTKKILQGSYDQRIATSQIQELNDLAEAINYLTEQLTEQLVKLKHQAFHDSLTTLPNRALFNECLQQTWAQAKQNQSLIAVLFIDLDGFKQINDRLGHKAGDQLLVAVAQRLQRCLRAGDTLARLGGDEFTVLLEGIDCVRNAVIVAERIAQQLQAAFWIDNTELFVSASIGIMCHHASQARPEDFLKNADAAMYQAKKKGKARHQVFDLHANSYQSLALEAELAHAIAHDQLQVYYQPVVELATGRVCELEALLYWQHPQRGLLAAEEFMPFAQKTELTLQIEQWLLKAACQQIRFWQTRYHRDFVLSVNVNFLAQQFQSFHTLQIAQTLAASGLAPQSLQLGISQRAVIRQDGMVAGTLQELKALGIKLAINDFDAVAMENTPQQLRIDTLKIERQLIAQLDQRIAATAVVRAAIAFAHTLNLTIAATGVTTAAQASRLQALNCDRAQGSYFATPLAHDACDAWLQVRARPVQDLSIEVAAIEKRAVFGLSA